MQECPSGVVNEDTFKYIYAQFFPQGGQSVFSLRRMFHLIEDRTCIYLLIEMH